MIVFMYLMMMVMLDIVGFFQQVGTMVRSYGEVYFFGWLIFPKTIFTLCRPERSGPEGMSGDLLYFLNTIDGTPGNQPGNQYEGFPRCIEEYDLAAILQGTASKYPANLDQGQMEILRDAMDAVSADPTILLPGEDFLRGHEAVAAIVEKANNDLILPFTEMITTTDLIFFLMVRFIVLIALTFLLEQFMRKIPHTAARLAGVNYAGRLAGGEVGPQDMPGAQKGDAFDGVNVGLARFRKTAFGEGNYPRGFIRSAPRRFRDGVVAGVTGGMKHNVSKTIRDSGDLGINRNMRMETKRDANYMEQVRMGNIRPNSLDAKQTGRTTRKGSDRR
ncbi:MAG: hypothetical protein MK052_02200 [Alphaproteobacteria bacterium]|nr:hypothetical protein [Alphaproteobacteria bacterium]